MHLALVGTGRMGRAVEAVAEARGHTIAARFDAERPLLDARDADALAGADVCVDFTTPDLALDHLHRYASWGVDAVVGTTGWYDDLATVRGWVAEGGNGVLYAPNFSLGVALVVRALEALAPLVDAVEEFDVAIHEAHHTGKVDSPSGTALRLAKVVTSGVARKTHVEPEAQHGAIDPAALHVSSARVGHVVGEHTVTIDGPSDQITLAHRAKDRRAFAAGAVRAAEWIRGRAGLFTLDDLLDDAAPAA